MKLLLGDCRKVMAELDADSLDACVTDPPYELNFMNCAWDRQGVAFDPETWSQAYRVLKPGAYLLCFGGARTSHRIACAIEDVGFEYRETIVWCYSSGMPKNLDASKAIDKHLGVERKQVGTKRLTGNALTPTAVKGGTYAVGAPNTPAGDVPVTVAGSPEAAAYEGYGTALKPAAEPIVVARKPMGQTLARNLLQYGTGALNIDGCRATGGRWPANFVLSHADGCKIVSYEWDKGYTINRFDDGAKPFGGGAGHDYTSQETPPSLVPVYQCVEGCVVKQLGEPSKFFNVFESNLPPFLYYSKASVKERERGLGSFEAKLFAQGNGARNAIARGESDYNLDGETGPTGFNRIKVRKNIHPTVKPLALMRHLVRLVAPPGESVIILDPFLGSGTTGMACVLEGHDFIGIEQNQEYLALAEARIRWAADQPVQTEFAVDASP